MRLAVIVNVHAGAVRRLGADACRASLEEAFAGKGIEADIAFVEGDEIGKRSARALASARAGRLDAVAVGGGDGTIRTVAAILAGSDVPLGVLPFGTLNHFAKDLGLPLDPAGAAATITASNAIPVDVGEVNGELFINNSSVGIYPYVVADRERQQAAGRPKWLAMIFALFRAARRFPRRRLRVLAEGIVKPYRTPVLFVGNNRYGENFMSWGRGGPPTDGLLHLYVAKAEGPFALLWVAIRAIVGAARLVRGLDVVEARTAEVRSRASRLRVALDGEVTTLETPLRYRSREKALRVFVPAAAARSDDSKRERREDDQRRNAE